MLVPVLSKATSFFGSVTITVTTTSMRGDPVKERLPDLPQEAESLIWGAGASVSLQLPQSTPIARKLNSLLKKVVFLINISMYFWVIVVV